MIRSFRKAFACLDHPVDSGHPCSCGSHRLDLRARRRPERRRRPQCNRDPENPDTGLSRRVQTDASGNYEFLSVPVGENYSLQVRRRDSRPAFKPA